ncbi:MAG: hypothetical protein DWQ34_00240 [Planctomycetota bacterium]|nr:MAG: hypothetical protein DWQ29_22930 [Planctomycetota bacterium]REJ98454.1 MAG: hypothetical protein DWQ34_00240 [Planctomycetota bacterium]REK23631.1 MAG: hypothetical protein DWQ41_16485 [Planctomycetota bacterium]REK31142.1 MAG: hypothetical protein DWQ45_20045 [Planctomycetota bacterium]
MQLVLLTALLAGGGTADAEPGFDNAADAAAVIAPQLQTGTLIFSEGDCLAIKAYSAGPFTHVAAVVIRGDEPWVYDSMNGVGVRKLTLERYLASQVPDEIHLFHPSRRLTDEESRELETALEDRLGTPYAVMHHVTGNRSEKGVHCAEYVTDALMSVGLIRAERPPKVSPASLAEGITKNEIYTNGVTIQVARPEPTPPDDASWCGRMWFDTKLCCTRCCDQLTGWFLCR